MTIVRVLKDWKWPDLMRQTPGHTGIWDGIQFTEQPMDAYDYVVVLNRVPQDTTLRCPPASIWAVIQEPPVPEYRWLAKGFDRFGRVYTPDTTFEGPRFIHSHGALPWHVNRDYDYLKACTPPEKKRTLSWVTSSSKGRAGHRLRMEFLDRLQQQVQFDVWGRGFQPIDDKWDGLAPYRYGLAIENHSAPYYWTEKIVDCFLAWTMPIYYGCTNIYDYFPKEAMIQVDITKPDEAIGIIKDTIQSDLYLRRRDAIAEARRLILDRYQFFPFMTALIEERENKKPTEDKQTIFLPRLPFLYPYPELNNKPQGSLKILSGSRTSKHGISPVVALAFQL